LKITCPAFEAFFDAPTTATELGAKNEFIWLTIMPILLESSPSEQT
jgi:hypothetical protein